MDYTILYFIILGVVGGATHVIVKAEKWTDLQKFGSFKRTILGAIIGGIYYLLYSDYNFPNMVMAWVTGYMGTDFIQTIITRLSKKTET